MLTLGIFIDTSPDAALGIPFTQQVRAFSCLGKAAAAGTVVHGRGASLNPVPAHLSQLIVTRTDCIGDCVFYEQCVRLLA